ncbi:MAG: hypothetical protein NT075_17900 [Chloroflexi bacterium]|nr:hypothetical protein [Chloroflexota bacterium]
MLEQHPDILNDLFKIRAEEYQQRAANYRLSNSNRENRESVRPQLAKIGNALLASFRRLLAWKPSQPSSRRIAQEVRRSS